MRGFSTVIVLVIVVNIVSITAVPSYGSNQFFGYAYWNERCAMDYKDDWLGFWNNHYNGRNEYRRNANPSTSCPLGCDCTKQELDCRHFTGSDLNMYSKVNVIRNGQLPVGLLKIEMINVGLTHIEGNVFHNLTNLKTLELGENKLKVMPDVSLNRKLETLILDNNEIEIIIENVTALPKSLKELVLLHNKIKFIPDRMFDLPNLQRVSLSHNELSRFPEFYNSKKLELVFVDYNKIKSISYTSLQAFFGNNSLLKHLNFSHNQITYIPPKALSNLIHLKILELHVNSITTIDAQVFYNIPELCHLDLRGNKIKVLTTLGYTPVFKDLPKLKTLILTGQSPKTTTIMYNAFKSLPNLEHLWLDFNDLQHFPNPAFSQEEWPNIKDLHIENNKLRTFSSYSSTDFPPDMKVLWSSLKVKNKPFSKMKNLQTFATEMER